MIRTENLVVSYGKKQVLKGVSLEIKEGELVALVGPNGCGKSTLLKAIARILKADSGEIFLMGTSLRKIPTNKIARKMTILPQIRQTPSDFDVETLVRYGRFPYGGHFGKLGESDKKIITWALTKTGMNDYAKTKLTSLSGGERQRAWIAMALAQKTDIIILDEPTSFLDLAYQIEVLELLKKLNQEDNITILLVLHDLNQAIRYADRVYIMKEGQMIFDGSPDEVINKENLRDVFRVDSDFYMDKREQANFFIPYHLQ